MKEGEVLITSPWKIAVHYLKTYFVVDFVAAIPWDLLASFNSGTEEVSALHAKLSFEFHVFLMSTLSFFGLLDSLMSSNVVYPVAVNATPS